MKKNNYIYIVKYCLLVGILLIGLSCDEASDSLGLNSAVPDYELTLKFLKITKVHVIPESLVAFTWRGDSVTYLNKNKNKIIKDDLKSLNYVKKNFIIDFNDKINIEFKKLKLIFKLILTKIGIM